jgi:hypothetical protein
LFFITLALTGCVQTSDLYAVRQWEGPKPGEPDDRPRINFDQLEAKVSFVEFVKHECTKKNLGEKAQQAFPVNSWSNDELNWQAAVCVQRIAAYATDQCIIITRRQNVVAADANLALGAVTLTAGLAAVSYAIKGSSDDRITAASLAGAASASNTSRGFIPTNSIVKVADFLAVAPSYAAAIGITNGDLEKALNYEPLEAHNILGKWSVENQKRQKEAKTTHTRSNIIPRPEITGDVEMIKFARVHDAVFANCSANAYGVVPAAKPFR